ncbi:ras gtpase-activating protein [Anaeramoeba ignava]|uniref:Ras gtpase-activating protein n=1 Tax=Anaeramoeba ignava TaxID=1746090 RepID=A0A9Q0LMW8_ANAIG|nr:ras gtpase-activating protein [Anaeramoeba ignava]
MSRPQPPELLIILANVTKINHQKCFGKNDEVLYSPQKILINWVNSLIDPLQISNFSKDWKNGAPLKNLLSKLFPDLIFPEIEKIHGNQNRIKKMLEKFSETDYSGFTCLPKDIANGKENNILKFIAYLYIWIHVKASPEFEPFSELFPKNIKPKEKRKQSLNFSIQDPVVNFSENDDIEQYIVYTKPNRTLSSEEKLDKILTRFQLNRLNSLGIGENANLTVIEPKFNKRTAKNIHKRLSMENQNTKTFKWLQQAVEKELERQKSDPNVQGLKSRNKRRISNERYKPRKFFSFEKPPKLNRDLIKNLSQESPEKTSTQKKVMDDLALNSLQKSFTVQGFDYNFLDNKNQNKNKNQKNKKYFLHFDKKESIDIFLENQVKKKMDENTDKKTLQNQGNNNLSPQTIEEINKEEAKKEKIKLIDNLKSQLFRNHKKIQELNIKKEKIPTNPFYVKPHEISENQRYQFNISVSDENIEKYSDKFNEFILSNLFEISTLEDFEYQIQQILIFIIGNLKIEKLRDNPFFLELQNMVIDLKGISINLAFDTLFQNITNFLEENQIIQKKQNSLFELKRILIGGDNFEVDPFQIYFELNDYFETDNYWKDEPKELKNYIFSFLDFYSICMNFKRKLTFKLTSLISEEKIIQQGYSFKIYGLLHQYFNETVGGMNDIPFLQEVLIKLLERFGIEKHEKKAKEMIENSRKQSVGKILRLVTKHLFEDNKANQKSIRNNEKEPTESTSLLTCIEKGEKYLGTFLRRKDIEYLYNLMQLDLTQTAIGSLSTRITTLFEPFGHLAFLKFQISKHVFETSTPSFLFRSNEITSISLTNFAKFYGNQYLKTVLSHLIKEINDSNFNFEVNPELSSSYSKNTSHLRKYFKIFLQSIFNSVHLIPYHFKSICQHIKSEVSAKFPQTEFDILGTFLFIRCFCPAIVSPHSFGIIDWELKETAKRGLVLIASILTNLATGIKFGESKSYMKFMNSEISKNEKKLKQFFQKITQHSQFLFEESFNEAQPTQLQTVNFRPQTLCLENQKQTTTDLFAQDIFLIIDQFNEEDQNKYFGESTICKIGQFHQKMDLMIKEIEKLEIFFKFFQEFLFRFETDKTNTPDLDSLFYKEPHELKKNQKRLKFSTNNKIALYSQQERLNKKTIIEGEYLVCVKIKGIKKAWKKRHLVLKGKYLAVYEPSESTLSIPIDVIDIDPNCTIKEEPRSKYKKKRRLSLSRFGFPFSFWISFKSSEEFNDLFTKLKMTKDESSII